MASYVHPLTAQINAAKASLTIKVKRSGRVRAPNLPDPQLRAIGDKMVAEQKARWSRHMNAQGQDAKKLSVKYAIIKQAVLHKRPFRDMKLSGRLVANFLLRKAQDGKIRAENTTRLERKKAATANKEDQMIGFAMSDFKVALDATKLEYGSYVRKAWIPVDGTGRRPSALNMVTP